MRILLGTCVWGGVLKELRDANYDVVWVGNWPADPGDEEILSRAYNEDRVLITLDKDFGELAVARGMPHSGILRLVNFPAILQVAVCLRVLSMKGEELKSGAIIIAEPGRIRIRPPDA